MSTFFLWILRRVTCCIHTWAQSDNTWILYEGKVYITLSPAGSDVCCYHIQYHLWVLHKKLVLWCECERSSRPFSVWSLSFKCRSHKKRKCLWFPIALLLTAGDEYPVCFSWVMSPVSHPNCHRLQSHSLLETWTTEETYLGSRAFPVSLEISRIVLLLSLCCHLGE